MYCWREVRLNVTKTTRSMLYALCTVNCEERNCEITINLVINFYRPLHTPSKILKHWKWWYQVPQKRRYQSAKLDSVALIRVACVTNNTPDPKFWSKPWPKMSSDWNKRFGLFWRLNTSLRTSCSLRNGIGSIPCFSLNKNPITVGNYYTSYNGVVLQVRTAQR